MFINFGDSASQQIKVTTIVFFQAKYCIVTIILQKKSKYLPTKFSHVVCSLYLFGPLVYCN